MLRLSLPIKTVTRAPRTEMEKSEARRWYVSGRVQGVGFRWFVEKNATALGLRGWVRNEDDGRVQVYAIGTTRQLNELAGLLHRGPRMAEVRRVEEQEAAMQQLSSFRTL
jgi:acylphosphatase